MTNQLKIRMINPMHDILLPSREEIVDYYHLVPLHHEAVDEVGADEAGSAGY